MAATRQHDALALDETARARGLPLHSAVNARGAPGAVAGDTDMGCAFERLVNQSKRRSAGIEQGQVDGKFAAALDKLAGAVQGIEHPQLRPLAALPQGLRIAFFGEQGQVRRQAAQTRLDNPVRGQIGLGKRRVIGFFVHDNAATGLRRVRASGVVGENRLGRVVTEIDDGQHRLARQGLLISKRHGA